MTANHAQYGTASEDLICDWFKSSYSNGAGGECLECAVGSGGGVLVRDSKRAGDGVLTVGARAWANFVTGFQTAS
ncbi:DUF397 domain-containing protein [Streptomyces kunmingensis]|uniref:DUF397 domain-containing protein n=1 Tax=Streptomyces kunmingensis TaxID=68225 RepID=A0ABU6CEX7_9ACTN|nr:DUF397 domain-containing protein [Streptomyces kunmingensis]MEB3962566.1 DUF397 domain-containing protein [Streptomyces kunmingensis]